MQQERPQECYRNLSEDEKIKKINYANNRNKIILDKKRERKKEYMRNYYYHLINYVDKLEC